MKKIFCIVGGLVFLVSVLFVWQHKKTEVEVMTGIVKKINDSFPSNGKVVVVFEDVVFIEYDKNYNVIKNTNKRGEVCIFRNISPEEYSKNFLFLEVDKKAEVVSSRKEDGSWRWKVNIKS